MNESKKSLSFVIPCRNEQETIGQVLAKINSLCEHDFRDRKTQVIVCDNGSTDRSVEICKVHGAHIVHWDRPGYGAALLRGIEEAIGEIVVFADADNTYDFLETPRLVENLEEGFDLVIGSRLEGNIHKGAMPLLHRYLGTPVLNFFLNMLYAQAGTKISDCNSGFRCFLRASFLSWGVKSEGMEFASEMLVKAMKSNARISHVPVSLYPDRAERAPHLERWRDGMRHLLQIFLDSPEFFFVVGCGFFAISWLIILLGLFLGPVQIGFAAVLGLHSMMFGLLGSLFGITIWAVGLYLAVRIDTRVKTYRWLIELTEDKLFWCSVILTVLGVALFSVVVIYWGIHGFRDLYIEKQTLVIVTFAANAMLFVSSMVTAHLLKRP
jgi:glycosyltransferase involved in cell wall biosynthesis